jgi:hypothetical protein
MLQASFSSNLTQIPPPSHSTLIARPRELFTILRRYSHVIAGRTGIAATVRCKAFTGNCVAFDLETWGKQM